MKIAITGKGGTGKTTLAGLLAHSLFRLGYRVLAVDADPDANLASALGIPPREAAGIIPLSRRTELIQERTGAAAGQFGQMFKLNPRVSDIPQRFILEHSGIKLLVLGAVQKGGGGCACPENVFLQSLLSEIILNRDESIIVDMEAGIEHLGRAVTRAIDLLAIVVEPGSRAVQTAHTIMRLARDIGVESFAVIANKVRAPEDRRWLASQFPPGLLIGSVSHSEAVLQADLTREPLHQNMGERLTREVETVVSALLDTLNSRIS